MVKCKALHYFLVFFFEFVRQYVNTKNKCRVLRCLGTFRKCKKYQIILRKTFFLKLYVELGVPQGSILGPQLTIQLKLSSVREPAFGYIITIIITVKIFFTFVTQLDIFYLFIVLSKSILDHVLLL